MTKNQLIRHLEMLVSRGELVVWIHGDGKGGPDFLASAVSICINGDSIQIEVSPDWKFRDA